MSYLTKIPTGSHGSNPTQKRYWKIVSDIVRIRDWHKYKRCISCKKYIYSWKELQAGHFKSWATCRGYSKWDTLNIFGQCAYCNTGFNGNEVGALFKEGIIERHGQERMDYINKLSACPSEKMDNQIIEGKIIEAINSMKDLPEQPEYYQLVIKELKNA